MVIEKHYKKHKLPNTNFFIYSKDIQLDSDKDKIIDGELVLRHSKRNLALVYDTDSRDFYPVKTSWDVKEYEIPTLTQEITNIRNGSNLVNLLISIIEDNPEGIEKGVVNWEYQTSGFTEYDRLQKEKDNKHYVPSWAKQRNL